MKRSDRDLHDLLSRGKWILTIEGAADGSQRLVARRPVGWDGPGDPYERLVATTHEEMRNVLSRRAEPGV